MPSRSASDHLFFQRQDSDFRGGSLQSHAGSFELRRRHNTARHEYCTEETSETEVRLVRLETTSDTRTRLQSLVVALRKPQSYKKGIYSGEKQSPEKQNAVQTKFILPSTGVLLPRDSKQVHVRLDVNVVRHRVDASEWICDLPVEIPDEL